MDRALYEADFVIGIITNDYLESTGAKEGFATITKDWREEFARFVPLFHFFVDIRAGLSVEGFWLIN